MTLIINQSSYCKKKVRWSPFDLIERKNLQKNVLGLQVLNGTNLPIEHRMQVPAWWSSKQTTKFIKQKPSEVNMKVQVQFKEAQKLKESTTTIWPRQKMNIELPMNGPTQVHEMLLSLVGRSYAIFNFQQVESSTQRWLIFLIKRNNRYKQPI